MKVTAHKDPVTGHLFESVIDLRNFQAKQRKDQAAREREELEKAEFERTRHLLCRELASKQQLPELVKKMYEATLRRRTLRAGKSHLQVLDVKVTNWRVSQTLRLEVGLDVTVSADPCKVYKGVFHDLSPTDVLYPFNLWGSGSTSQHNGNFTWEYGLVADLKQFPLLMQAMLQADALLLEAEQHGKAVEMECELRADRDADLQKLRDDLSKARQALHEAEAAHASAMSLASARREALESEVRAAMPFAKTAELDAITEATGLGEKPGWQEELMRISLRQSAQDAESAKKTKNPAKKASKQSAAV